jgi:hypothetical protein
LLFRNAIRLAADQGYFVSYISTSPRKKLQIQSHSNLASLFFSIAAIEIDTQEFDNDCRFGKCISLQDEKFQHERGEKGGHWECKSCTYRNPNVMGLCCEMCSAIRSFDLATVDATLSATSDPLSHHVSSPKAEGGNDEKETWSCDLCTVVNSRENMSCTCCGFKRPRKSKVQAQLKLSLFKLTKDNVVEPGDELEQNLRSSSIRFRRPKEANGDEGTRLKRIASDRSAGLVDTPWNIVCDEDFDFGSSCSSRPFQERRSLGSPSSAAQKSAATESNSAHHEVRQAHEAVVSTRLFSQIISGAAVDTAVGKYSATKRQRRATVPIACTNMEILASKQHSRDHRASLLEFQRTPSPHTISTDGRTIVEGLSAAMLASFKSSSAPAQVMHQSTHAIRQAGVAFEIATAIEAAIVTTIGPRVPSCIIAKPGA